MNKNLIILSIAVIAVLAVGYNFLPKSGAENNASAENTSLANQDSQNQVMFSVDAKKWQFTPEIIRVKKGQRAKIIINNTDVLHGINLPDFNAIGDNDIEFLADKTGEFIFYCKNFCGEGHRAMQGKIIVTE